MSAPNSISFERAAEFYDRTRGGLDRGRRFAAKIGSELEPQSRVLEIGVGTGLIALPLLESGFEITGIDIAHAMLEKAHERLGSRVAQADAAQLPVVSGSQDAVVAVWVFHVVGDREAVMAEVARVLRPGGRLVVVCADAKYEADDIVGAVDDLLVQLGRVRDQPDVVTALARAAGLTRARTTESDRYEHDATPEEVAAQLERREMSSLWDLDDATWARVVQPAIDRLRALPDQDRARTERASHPILVFEKGT